MLSMIKYIWYKFKCYFPARLRHALSEFQSSFNSNSTINVTVNKPASSTLLCLRSMVWNSLKRGTKGAGMLWVYCVGRIIAGCTPLKKQLGRQKAYNYVHIVIWSSQIPCWYHSVVERDRATAFRMNELALFSSYFLKIQISLCFFKVR